MSDKAVFVCVCDSSLANLRCVVSSPQINCVEHKTSQCHSMLEMAPGATGTLSTYFFILALGLIMTLQTF